MVQPWSQAGAKGLGLRTAAEVGLAGFCVSWVPLGISMSSTEVVRGCGGEKATPGGSPKYEAWA